jgi:hypothetical protein
MQSPEMVGVVPLYLIGKARALRVVPVSLGAFSLVEEFRYLPAPTCERGIAFPDSMAWLHRRFIRAFDDHKLCVSTQPVLCHL